MEKNKQIPQHIGIIMDGNRRWAKERNLPTVDGHLKGYAKLKEMPQWFFDRGVKTISVFAFSTENWNRSKAEVDYLMRLIKKAFTEDLEEFNRRGYRVILSGRIDELPGDLPAICAETMNKTRNNTGGTLNICLNYGGRAEIIDVMKKMIKHKLTVEQVHEGMIRKYLYGGNLGDPDLVVRTSGEQRISGFMLWQMAYSELLFLQKYWPDFEEGDAEKVLNDYADRKRRFGGD